MKYVVALLLVAMPSMACAQTPASSPAAWCSDLAQRKLIEADNAEWARREVRPHPSKWLQYSISPHGCHQPRATALREIMLARPGGLSLSGDITGRNPGQGSIGPVSNDAKLVSPSHFHGITLSFSLDIPSYPALGVPKRARALYIMFRCNWDGAFNNNIEWHDSSKPGASCNLRGQRRGVSQVDFRLGGSLAPFFHLEATCWKTNSGAGGGPCYLSEREAAEFHTIRIKIVPRFSFNDYLKGPVENEERQEYERAAIAPPAVWSSDGQGGTVLSLMRNSSDFATPSSFSYRVCHNEGTVAATVIFGPNQLQKIKIGECLEVDRPTFLFIHNREDVSQVISGTYEVFSGGTLAGPRVVGKKDLQFFAPGRVVFPLRARCVKLPSDFANPAPKDTYGICNLIRDGGSPRSFRVCFGPGYAPHGSSGTDYPGTYLRLVLQRKPPTSDPEDWTNSVLGPIGCRDLLNVRQAYILVRPAKPVPGYNPADVKEIRYAIYPIPPDSAR
ncbi:MAG: hypothetical protein KDJ41_14300 [Hyphomicrobiaceae bacterium]|nr:hypothetical protein [Hyphomicrobiaceae bacterium]